MELSCNIYPSGSIFLLLLPLDMYSLPVYTLVYPHHKIKFNRIDPFLELTNLPNPNQLNPYIETFLYQY